MPHWRSMIEKDHLGAWDLVGKDDKPRDYTLEIAKVESNLLKTREQPKGKRKCVITFKGAQKKMVANTTNCETIESMYGPDTADWLGKRITLYQTKTRNPKGGGQIACIRVRPQMPQGKAEGIESRPVDEAMRAEQDEAFGREPGEEG
jgi:hypothetical protein